MAQQFVQSLLLTLTSVVQCSRSSFRLFSRRLDCRHCRQRTWGVLVKIPPRSFALTYFLVLVRSHKDLIKATIEGRVLDNYNSSGWLVDLGDSQSDTISSHQAYI